MVMVRPAIGPNKQDGGESMFGEETRPESWLGRTEERRDVLAPWPAAALHAALDRPGDPPEKGDPLPPLWRWLFFKEAERRSALGRDGHAERGAGLIPPIAAPRRVWASGRFRFHRTLKLGANATRYSAVADLKRKRTAAGPFTLLTLRHDVMTRDGLMETEEQDLVYRPDPEPIPEAERLARGRQGPVARQDETWRRVWSADPTLLFRYSALTFNSHRIHYDLDYCREVEGYPGLVVHAPLLATMMLELAREHGPDRKIAAFEFRSCSPVIHTEAFEICGAPFETSEHAFSKQPPAGADLWVRAAGPSGRWGVRLAMTGRLLYA